MQGGVFCSSSKMLGDKVLTYSGIRLFSHFRGAFSMNVYRINLGHPRFGQLLSNWKITDIQEAWQRATAEGLAPETLLV